MIGIYLSAVLFSAPPPAAPAAPPKLSESAAVSFAEPVVNLLERIREEYVRPVEYDALVHAVARALYRAAGEKDPVGLGDAVKRAVSKPASLAFLLQTRLALGDRPDLRDPHDFLAALYGLAVALDPYCEPVLDSAGGAIGRSSVESNLGVEFAGVGNEWWIAHSVLRGSGPPGFSTVVGRVAPGGFAARNGLKPGDRILSVGGIPVEPSRFDEFAQKVRTTYTTFLSATIREEYAPPPKVAVGWERDGIGHRTDFHADRDPDRTDSVTGVGRTDKGEWTFLLPAPTGGPKIGFVRLGVLDYGAAMQFGEALNGLQMEGASGIVLDLRGCPGGYVSEASVIAERLIATGKILYTSKGRGPDASVKCASGDDASYGKTVPLLLLVDGTTQGGGELIAAAVRDAGRAPVTGRRTFGKGVILTTVPTGRAGLLFRLCSGISLRPNGTDRHRYPHSRPDDPWGIRPDPGFDIVTSPEFELRVKGWYDLHAIRPWKSTDALPLDDPLNDPALRIAVKKLTERVRAAGPKQ